MEWGSLLGVFLLFPASSYSQKKIICFPNIFSASSVWESYCNGLKEMYLGIIVTRSGCQADKEWICGG